MEHIETIESEARQNLQRSIITGKAAKMIGIYAVSNLFVDSSQFSDMIVSLVYFLARCMVAFIVAALLMLCIAGLYWIGFSHQPFMSDFRQQPTTQQRHAGGQRARIRQSSGQRGAMMSGFNFRTEEEMISEAIARSLADQ